MAEVPAVDLVTAVPSTALATWGRSFCESGLTDIVLITTCSTGGLTGLSLATLWADTPLETVAGDRAALLPPLLEVGCEAAPGLPFRPVASDGGPDTRAALETCCNSAVLGFALTLVAVTALCKTIDSSMRAGSNVAPVDELVLTALADADFSG